LSLRKTQTGRAWFKAGAPLVDARLTVAGRAPIFAGPEHMTNFSRRRCCQLDPILKPSIDVTDIAARDGLVLCLGRAPWVAKQYQVAVAIQKV
jgi:hypothetical protein